MIKKNYKLKKYYIQKIFSKIMKKNVYTVILV